MLNAVAVALLTGAMLAGQTPANQGANPPRASAPRAKATTRSRAFLGVAVTDLGPDRVRELKLYSNSGTEVEWVDQEGPAAKAGIREHDVLVSFNGKKLANSLQLYRSLLSASPRQWVDLGVMRDGQSKMFRILLGSRNQKPPLSPKSNLSPPPPPPVPTAPDVEVPHFGMLQFWSRSGLVLEDLTPQLGDFFGVRNGEGVLVRSVERGSVAAIAGLRAGDVIVKVNGDAVSCAADWRQAVRRHAGAAVFITIIREKREQTLALKLPENRASSSRPAPSKDPLSQIWDTRSELDDTLTMAFYDVEGFAKKFNELPCEMQRELQDSEKDQQKLREMLRNHLVRKDEL